MMPTPEQHVVTMTLHYEGNVSSADVYEVFRGDVDECKRVLDHMPAVASDDRRKIIHCAIGWGTLESWNEFLQS